MRNAIMGVGRSEGRRDLSGKESGMKYQTKDNYDLSRYTRSNLDKKRRTNGDSKSEGSFSLFEIVFVIIILAIVVVILAG